MQSLYSTIESAAVSKATVFITGESGTGKELCAEAIHHNSPRQEQAFIPINCAAIPGELMESEIFGHVKGAFTGAHSTRVGAAQRANNGTLFLDEICEMDLSLQTKLLRFIQTGTFSKVGSDSFENVDIRIICATNRDPMEEVSAGRFREDLYYRLHVIPMQIPPLRERGRDILLIAHQFLKDFSREESKHFSGFAPMSENMLKSYEWPGNVRELQNVIRNIVVMHRGELVTPDMLPKNIRLRSVGKTPSDAVTKDKSVASSHMLDSAEIQPLWRVEKDAIHTAIEVCQGNVPKAAALLEVSPSTLYRKIKQWEGVNNDGARSVS
jgi:two-component system repressor protein LuxO